MFGKPKAQGSVSAWQPRGDQIFVRPLMPPDRTSSGILLAETSGDRERPTKGVVLAVGPGLAGELTRRRQPMQSRVGDLVMFGKFAGMEETIDGERVLIMRDQEALAAQPVDSYSLTTHVDSHGRRLWHEASLNCDLCPKSTSTVLQEERERLVRESFAVPAPAGEDAPKLVSLE